MVILRRSLGQLTPPRCRSGWAMRVAGSRLRNGAGELRMTLGQRVAHVAPKRRRRIRGLRGELLVGAGGAFPKVEAEEYPCPSRLRAHGRLDGRRSRSVRRNRPRASDIA